MNKQLLKNHNLVVTRPAGQADTLINALETAGANVLHFPALNISPLSEQKSFQEQGRDLNSYQIIIFISRNAVIYGMPLLNSEKWPPNIRIAAIGSGTAQQLQQLGYAADIVSRSTANSEGLLAEARMLSVKGLRILIVRGRGGREKLAETLRTRGASVDYFECYQRTMPTPDLAALHRLWDTETVPGFILSSAEGLSNLYQMLNKDDIHKLNNASLFVISSTMVDLCAKLGYKSKPVLMPSARYEDVVQAVISHYTN